MMKDDRVGQNSYVKRILPILSDRALCQAFDIRRPYAPKVYLLRITQERMPREVVERASIDYPADAIIIFRNLVMVITDKLQEVNRNAVSEDDPMAVG
jgi:hypothetical protein